MHSRVEPTETLSRFLLDLYRAAREAPLESFQPSVYKMLISRISTARIRIPRTQGCPPHFPGSDVIRESSFSSWSVVMAFRKG